jgi:signal transduction histidine kinase
MAILWRSPFIARCRALITHWQHIPYSGTATLCGGTVLATLAIWLCDHTLVYLSDPGLVYLPLVAMLAYHWGARHAVIAALLQLICVYFFFLAPQEGLKWLTPQSMVQLLILAGVTGFVLALVQLARERRTAAEHETERLAALQRVGAALTSELDEERLLNLIASTARDLTGASVAAFTLRPTDELGQLLVPPQGNLFHLAAVVGVTPEQEQLLRRMPLGGEGLLAPIFRQGIPVRIVDALAFPHATEAGTPSHGLDVVEKNAQQSTFAYLHGHVPQAGLHSVGIPRGHPMIRSFLGAPLLNREREVSGGLLLGHSEPGRFTQEDEALLIGLTAQAAIALENARLYRIEQIHAQELDATFESIADGVILLDSQGHILRENGAAHRLRKRLEQTIAGKEAIDALLHTPARQALSGCVEPDSAVSVVDEQHETREYIVNATLLRLPTTLATHLLTFKEGREQLRRSVSGVVVVWHDVTEARHLLIERTIHAETEARRALLQLILNELPSSVYLVRGPDARLVLANRAATTLWGAKWPTNQPMCEFLHDKSVRIARIDGRELPCSQLATLRAVQHGEVVRHHQEIIRHADGTTLPVLVNAVPLRMNHFRLSSWSDSEGASDESESAALVVHQDVTALKAAEQLKDEFIGIAAHELRTPVAVLKGYAQMLLMQTARGKGPALADWQMEALQSIDQATFRLVELTEDLLNVKRLQAGRLHLSVEAGDLVALARRVMTRMQMTTKQHTLSLSTSLPHLIVETDIQRLEQVLTNIINNAIKYSPQGGAIEIAIREWADQKIAQISVRDFGIGIPEEQQSRIFGRFERAENANAYGITGTGLGLYLCREMIERLGGQIWFESVEGQGSTFFLTLPLPDTVEERAK